MSSEMGTEGAFPPSFSLTAAVLLNTFSVRRWIEPERHRLPAASRRRQDATDGGPASGQRALIHPPGGVINTPSDAVKLHSDELLRLR